MDISFQQLQQTDEWKKATPAARAQAEYAYARDFWNEATSSQEYASYDDDRREQFKEMFANLFTSGRSIINQTEGPNRGFFENIKDLAVSGGKSMLAVSRVADDVASENIDDNTAGLLAESFKEDSDRYTPPELQEMQDAVKEPSKEWDQAEGFWDSAKAAADMAGTVIKQAVTNPKGLAYMTAEQVGNMAPGLAGMAGGSEAGAAAGSLVAPGPGTAAGAAIGGFVGAFMGQWGIEAGSEFKGMVANELTSRGLEPTEENIASILGDENFIKSSTENARDKATATSAVSAIMTFGAGRIASGPARAAEKAAIARLGTGATREAIDAEVQATLAARTLADKAKTGAAAFGTEIAEEPASEAAGQKAGYGKVDMGEVALETLGGIGGAAAEVPAAARAFGRSALDATKPKTSEQIVDELPEFHTVDDVLKEHRENTIAESSEARREWSDNSDTVGGVLGEEPPPIEDSMSPPLDNAVSSEQPAAGDINATMARNEPASQVVAAGSPRIYEAPTPEEIERLKPALQGMVEELYPMPDSEGSISTELPPWVKLKALKAHDKATGENTTSYVNSRSARETLRAVRRGNELTEKQKMVWGYLKGIAETHPGAIVPEWTPEEQRLQDEARARNDALIAKSGVRKTAERPVVPMESAQQQPATRTPEDVSDETFRDMAAALHGAETVEDLNGIHASLSGYMKNRPELSHYAERFNAERDAVEARLAGNADLPSAETVTAPPEGGASPANGAEEGNLRDSDRVNSPEAGGNNADQKAGGELITPAAVLPNAERHEVIDNPDSLSHGHEVNTSPSEAQKEAGNYKKSHVSLDGMDISIENPAGSTRKGVDKDGKAWESEMKADYGYVKGSVGYDKDHVDVFIKPGYQGGAKDAYIVNQHGKDGSFDEHKAVLGASSESEAMAVYNANYEAGWTGGKSITAMPVAEFKEWAKSDAPKAGPVSKSVDVSEGLKRTAPETVEDANKTSDSQGFEGVSKSEPIVEHTVKKSGKIIKGVVRRDITKGEAKAIDPYSFPKDGGFFIREKYLTGDDARKNQTLENSKIETPKDGEKQEATQDGLSPETPRAEQFNKEVSNEANDGSITGRQDKSDEPGGEGIVDPGQDKLAPDKEDDSEAGIPRQSGDKFSGNKIFTTDAVESARARLKAKRNTLSAGFDPELMQDLLVIGGAHFEAGVRSFAAWSKAVLEDIGQEFKPFLRGTYENLRHYPGLDVEGMSSADDVSKEMLKGEVSKAKGEEPVAAKEPVPLSEISVTYDAIFDGGEISVEENAEDALAAADEDIEELYQLLTCLNS